MLSFELNGIMEVIFREGSMLTFLDAYDKKLIIVDHSEHVIYANQKARATLHQIHKTIQGKQLRSFFNLPQLKAVLLEGISYSAVPVEIGHQSLNLNMSPIEVNRDLVGAVITFQEDLFDVHDISTMKLCNSISRELESVFNASYDEIIVTDHTGTVLKMNTVFRKFYNLNADDFVGKNVIDLEQAGIFSPSVTAKVLKEKKRVSIIQKTNTDKVLIVTGHPVFDKDNELISVISMAKDITEMHRLKEKLAQVEKTAQKYYYELEQLKQKEEAQELIQFRSPQMAKVMTMVEKIARVDSNLLITGESGVGKSLIAESIHRLGGRNGKEIVCINCGAIPESLMESEFFGYERGAFTGARSDGKLGKLDLADEGTLFLDEISELSLPMQVKLLKVIQEKKFMRVGGIKTIASDFRLIAATNKDLQQEIKAGRFREDLFYRLNVVPIEIPPLRERKEDIVLLINYFWRKLNRKYGTSRKIEVDVYDVLTLYQWPGNVRELENCVERLMVTVDKDMLQVEDLPYYLVNYLPSETRETQLMPLNQAIDTLERKMIMNAYKLHKNTYKVAEVLGVSQSTVVRKLKKFGCEALI
jgi:PAS domain S-box-containing protein